MRARRLLVLATLLAAGLPARTAAAQDIGRDGGPGAPFASPAQEIAALEAELLQDAAQLSSGCGVACPALASMERAADRICALDPGPRCAQARAKVRDATRRVQQACGDCRTRDTRDFKPTEESKRGEKEAAERPAEAPPKPSPPPPASPGPTLDVASAPRHGGCAGCAVAGDEREALGAGLLAAVAALALVGRRRALSGRRGLRGGPHRDEGRARRRRRA
jgi:hypothetical protein